MTNYYVITDREKRVLDSLFPTKEIQTLESFCKECEDTCQVQGCKWRVL